MYVVGKLDTKLFNKFAGNSFKNKIPIKALSIVYRTLEIVNPPGRFL